MDDVIQALKKEHQLIHAAIGRLLGAAETCPSDPGALAGLERLILNHISKEDAQIYIPFKKISEFQAAKFFDLSRRHLEEIKILALVFFEKYKGEESEILSRGFAKDLHALAARIEERIDFEEKELFPFLTNISSRT